MNRTITDIREALEAVTAKWSCSAASEKGGAQSFLNDLVSAYTGLGVMDSGGEFERPVKRDEGRGFIDMIWDGVVLFEMKAPKESARLDTHRAQLLDYWRNCADVSKGIAAPPYAVLCSVDRFEVWEPGRFPNAPVDSFDLSELADHTESLLFLAGKNPVFGGPGVAVTREAAEHMVALYFQLVDREAAETDVLHRWVMQTVWVLFAEDLGLLQEHPVETLIQALLADGLRSTMVELTDLYRRLNTADEATRNRARPTPVPYVNGELFAEPAVVHLEHSELEHLLLACRFDWRHVNPTVFGALMEGCLGHSRRWELGAHYTSEEDILSIVRPVIIHPWVERIEAVEDPKAAVALVEELASFKVLDPAMGCGNFLSIAFRELRVLEALAHKKTVELHYAAGLNPPLLPHYSINNMYGIEIDEFAVEIAKITLWMTQAIETRKYTESAENPLPLQPLTNLVCADSLKIDWPDVNAIIGNPPFHGDRNLRGVVGDEYIDWLKGRFGVGVKDHCVYFFRKAHEELDPGERCGLVATNTISQAKNRDASLGWITKNDGVIFDATSTKPWSGEAKVHVSVVCWARQPIEPTFRLDGHPVSAINAALRPEASLREAQRLDANKGRAFQGYLLRGTGFVLDDSEARALLADSTGPYAEVVVPYLRGEQVVRSPLMRPDRWVIDFRDMPLEAAMRYPRALDILKERVRPGREHDPEQMKRWWQFWNTRKGLRAATRPLPRFMAACRVSKRLMWVWCEPNWRPNEKCVVLATPDDFVFGVLSSRVHTGWAWTHSSTLKADLNYIPASALETFPFPTAPEPAARERVIVGAQLIVDLRAKHCAEQNIGLTKIYNLMDEGGVTDLKAAHVELDLAVVAAYGWDESIVDDDAAILDALYDLNAQIAAGEVEYLPFG